VRIGLDCLLLAGFLGISACNPPLAADRDQPAPGPARFAAQVRAPGGQLRVEEGAQSVRLACAGCHSLRATAKLPEKPSDLREFHTGMQFTHGELRCASCHAEGQPPALHLATGERLELRDSLSLCAQCHGPQWRDFQHGAHGGMRGHWDLSRGGRERNHCIDCHDPHAPAFVGGLPVAPPGDAPEKESPRE
jgi:hypothetical protein